MLKQVNAHCLRRDLVVTDGLERAAIGGIYEQYDDDYSDHRYEERECGAELEHLRAKLYLHIAEGCILAQKVRAVCDNAEAVPLENRAYDLGKAEGRNGEIIALQAQHGDADERREHSCGEAGYYDADHCAQKAAQVDAQRVSEKLGDRKLDSTAVEVLIYRCVLSSRDGEYRIGISADEHKARLAEREQTSEAVEQVHGHAHQRIYRALFEHGDEHKSKF